MEIIINSIRNVFFGAVVFFINIPIFWSFTGVMDLVKDAVRIIGA